MDEKKQKIKELVELWAKFENIGVDCSGIFCFLSIEITEYLDEVVSEIYQMINAANFEGGIIKVEKIRCLINQINNDGMDYITNLSQIHTKKVF